MYIVNFVLTSTQQIHLQHDIFMSGQRVLALGMHTKIKEKSYLTPSQDKGVFSLWVTNSWVTSLHFCPNLVC